MDAEAVLTSILQRLRLATQRVTKARVLSMLVDYELTPGEVKRFWWLFAAELKAPRQVAWFMRIYEQRDTKRGWQARGKRVRSGSVGIKSTYFNSRDAGRIRKALAAGGSMKALTQVFHTMRQFEAAKTYTRKQVK